METLREAKFYFREAKPGWARGGFLEANVFSSDHFSVFGTGQGRARDGPRSGPGIYGGGNKKGGRWLAEFHVSIDTWNQGGGRGGCLRVGRGVQGGGDYEGEGAAHNQAVSHGLGFAGWQNSM